MQIPSELTVLPLRDKDLSLHDCSSFVSRERSIRAVDEALGENRMIVLVSQKDLDKERRRRRPLQDRYRGSTHGYAEASRWSHTQFWFKVCPRGNRFGGRDWRISPRSLKVVQETLAPVRSSKSRR